VHADSGRSCLECIGAHGAGSGDLKQNTDCAGLTGAHKHGLTRVDRFSSEGGAFMAKFEGGSVVRMKLLRRAAGNDNASASLR
jgi:hypothetical protein